MKLFVQTKLSNYSQIKKKKPLLKDKTFCKEFKSQRLIFIEDRNKRIVCVFMLEAFSQLKALT